jgi:hypothetical protein
MATFSPNARIQWRKVYGINRREKEKKKKKNNAVRKRRMQEHTCLHLVQAVKVCAIRPSGMGSGSGGVWGEGLFHELVKCGRLTSEVG